MVMMIGTAQLQKASFIKKQDLQEYTGRLIKMGKAGEGEDKMEKICYVYIITFAPHLKCYFAWKFNLEMKAKPIKAGKFNDKGCE